jgi:hypothetical protein
MTLRHYRAELWKGKVILSGFSFERENHLDYTGLAVALMAGTGVGDLPPLVRPELLREGKLIEVMLKWQFSIFHLWIVHMANHTTTTDLLRAIF